MSKPIQHVLRIDSSARRDGSISRELGDEIVERLVKANPGLTVVTLDLADGVAHIDADWVGANFTAVDERTSAQRDRLATSDDAIAAVLNADALVLTAPVYNFSIPSVLKAWIDHICRAGKTFRYTDKGPLGLVGDKPVYLAMASGGVEFGGPVDFASTYLRQVFRFIGIEDVRLIGAAGVAGDAATARQSALNTLEQWLPAQTGEAA
ncbi:FMN-dependent NADH-azoreductase [Thiosocius teredinicola]|uniref:FMN-dependent NADH-azoreductase n=1 Tax=Thiosocius teredinicola TaxID=1973002 RepID=UPI000990D373